MAKYNDQITAEYVRKRLDYNPSTGSLVWLPTEGDKRWNTRYAGKEAGSTSGDGYVKLRIDGVGYVAHRLIWLWMTGEWPKHGIDHINRIRGDNRWYNLREATQAQNSCNVGLNKSNTSGCKGVYWREGVGRWIVMVSKAKKLRYFGYYEDYNEACEASREARERLHGEFATHV